MKADMPFNAMTRETRENIKIARVKIKLNGFDVKSAPQDGFVRYGYTGKGWIMWQNMEILGDGWADTNVQWFEMVANFLNEKHPLRHISPPFVDLGFGAPKPNSRRFNRWMNNEARENGFEAAEQKIERLDTILAIKSNI